MKHWKILARHKWVEGATITELHNESKSTKDSDYRRFVATIRNFRNWVILEGLCGEFSTEDVVDEVKNIRDRIDMGDETVFYNKKGGKDVKSKRN